LAPSEVLVKFKPNTNQQEGIFAQQKGTPVLKVNKVLGYKHLGIPEGTTVQQMVQRYRENPDVEWAEPNYNSQSGYLMFSQWNLKHLQENSILLFQPSQK